MQTNSSVKFASFKYLFILTAVVLSLSLFASAESTNCTGATMIVPDGRITRSTIPGSTTIYLGFYSTSGHSYSIELTPDTEPYGGLPVAVEVQDGSTASYCVGPTTMPLHDTHTNDPVINAGGGMGGYRKTLTVATQIGNGLINIEVQNTSAAPHAYTYSITDLTLYNPRWTTWSGYYTNWGFKNTTSMPVQGTLNVYKDDGTLAATSTFTIPAHQMVQRLSSVAAAPMGLNVPANLAGGAEFYHDGPPGAILADAYYINGSVVVPSKFEPARQAQH